ncbi:MAG: acyl carrier protein [Clostridia bacterium]|nr:acyl carrier protein [Clostridia bacterium]
MKKQLMEILEELRPDVDFEAETALIDDGILSSMDIVAIVNETADAFDILIGVEHLIPENFNSVDGMIALIEELQDGE